MTAEMIKAKRILEIGMYTGYSAVSLAETAFCVRNYKNGY
jgi:predicted O-methyltransferase YrrM